MTQELTVREQSYGLTPAEVVENSTVQAKLLMDIVEKTKCYQEISGAKYLQVEAWETIGAFNRTHAETETITPISRENETIGYQARVQLWKDGVVVGGAVMPCYFTESCCKGKEGDAKHKACMSAAQTFATSKAYRMNFSYVAILAGYQPMPAEEITEDMAQPAKADKTTHYCQLHKTVFFMKGKMKSFAHPIKDAEGKAIGQWCHEHTAEPEKRDTRGEFEKEGRDLVEEATQKTTKKVRGEYAESPAYAAKKAQQKTPDSTEQATQPSDEGSKAETPEGQEEAPVVDMTWLKESLETLNWTTCVKWLNDRFKTNGKRVSEIMGMLTPDQQKYFAAEVESRLPPYKKA